MGNFCAETGVDEGGGEGSDVTEAEARSSGRDEWRDAAGELTIEGVVPF